MTKRLLAPLLTALVVCFCAPAAGAKGFPGVRPGNGVTVPGSPFRYLAIAPHAAPRSTLVERVDKRSGRVDRWWQLRGEYEVPAVAYDGSAGGLSGDGSTLVLSRSSPDAEQPAQRTRLAVLDISRRLRHPTGGPRQAFRRIDLRGDFSVDAISPDGSTAYLIHRLARPGGRPSDLSRYEIRALDLASGDLRPDPIVDPSRPKRATRGLPLTRATSRDGRWAYTLYDAGPGGRGDKAPYLQGLDTVAGQAVSLDLARLADLPRRRYYLLQLRQAGGRVEVWLRSPGPASARRLLAIDKRGFESP